MTKLYSDHLLFCLAEEAGEVAQAVGKIGRFGANSLSPKSISNFKELKREVEDIIAVWEMYCDEIHEESELNYSNVIDKQEKVLHYWRQFNEPM